MELLRLAVIFGVVFSALGNDYDKCKSGLPNDSPYQKKYAGKCYVVFTKSEIYREAEKKCEENGGTLAMPKSQDVNDVLKDLLVAIGTDGGYWFGLNDMVEEGNFVWEDGSDFNKTVFNNFAANNGPYRGFFTINFRGIKDCAAIGTDGQWHDYRCGLSFIPFNKVLPYACEYTADVPVKSPPATTTACPVNTCDKDCGLDGYKSKDGCFVCECAE